MDPILIKNTNGLLLNKGASASEGHWRSDNVYKFIFSPAQTIELTINNHKHLINEGGYVVINPHTQHRQVNVQKEKFLIELNPSFISNIRDSLSLNFTSDITFATQVFKNHQLTQWVMFNRDYFSSIEKDYPSPETAMFLDNSLTQLGLILIKLSLNNSLREWPVNNIENYSYPINKAITAMKEYYDKNWSLDELAVITGLSKYQFSHVFKEKIGVSPYSWLQIFRMQKSLLLLAETNKTILEIAMETGFSSITTYNKLFRKLYGSTPSFFRNQRKGNNQTSGSKY